MKETIIQQCIDLLKKDDTKSQIKTICEPILEILFEILNPYIDIIIFLLLLIFILLLGILVLLILLIRNRTISFK